MLNSKMIVLYIRRLTELEKMLFLTAVANAVATHSCTLRKVIIYVTILCAVRSSD